MEHLRLLCRTTVAPLSQHLGPMGSWPLAFLILWPSLPRNTMDALPACMLRDVTQEALNVSVIGIDEGQFVS